MTTKERKPFLEYMRTLQSFSKWITLFWMGLWIEVILFSEIATILQLGDTAAITTINDNVLQIGLIICGFYFSTKCVENVAKGVETYLMAKYNLKLNTNIDADKVEENEACG